MREEYKVFDKGFNKVIDLVEQYDSKVINKFKAVLNIMPNKVVDAMGECADFAFEASEYDVDFMRLVNAVSLDFSRKKNYLKAEVYIHRYFEDDLFKTDLNIKLMSVCLRNTPNKKTNMQLFYEEKDGAYRYVGSNYDGNEEFLDASWDVYLEMRDDEYYLISSRTFRGIEVYRKEHLISFDELYRFIEDQDDYEDDWEIEFDPDFDI